METVKEFSGEFQFLSNFAKSPIEWQGKRWPTVEHAYQAAKTLDEAEQEEVRLSPTPAKAKKLGRKISIREDWDNIKIDVMRELVIAKFEQNPDLKEKLKITQDLILEEGNWWGDLFWGISPAGSGIGQNNLGKILMEVRNNL